MMNRPMVLVDHIRTESGFLELAIHIGRDNERIALKMPDQGMQCIKPRMRPSIPIEIQSMAVEPPRKPGILDEFGRCSHGFEIDAELGKHRISAPKTVCPTKVWKT